MGDSSGKQGDNDRGDIQPGIEDGLLEQGVSQSCHQQSAEPVLTYLAAMSTGADLPYPLCRSMISNPN
jgi:hypothetical protein